MRVVPSATLDMICVSPRVNRAEPCERGAMSISVSIGRISSWARPSGRVLSTAMRLRMMSFSSLAKAALTWGDRLPVGLLVLGRRRVDLQDLMLDRIDRGHGARAWRGPEWPRRACSPL